MATRTQTKYKVTLHWKPGAGDPEVLEGWGTDRTSAAADAMNNAGIGGGALAALDYWDAVEDKDVE